MLSNKEKYISNLPKYIVVACNKITRHIFAMSKNPNASEYKNKFSGILDIFNIFMLFFDEIHFYYVALKKYSKF